MRLGEVFFMIAKARCGLVLLGICTTLAKTDAASLALVWDPSPSSGVTGYKIHAALGDGTQQVTYNVGNVTNAVVDNLVEGQTYNFYATAYDSGGNESGPSNTLNYTVPTGGPSPTPTVTFVTADNTTAGSWKGVYGSDGYLMAAVSPGVPPYATVATSAAQWTWLANSSNPTHLQVPGNSTNRIAACWYSSTQLAFDLSITDGKAHRVSMYFLDATASGRQERVDVVDPGSGATLDSRQMSNFASGIYLAWEITGRVTIRMTPSNVNAVTSALFFDPAGSTSQPTNHPPILASIPDQVANEGQILQFTASASDPDSGQTLSFSLANAPAGATINKDSGLFAWTPQPGQAPGTYPVTISVADNGQPSLSASRTFNISVREGFYLTLGSSANGTVQINPRGSLNADGTKYVIGTTVNASATAANGYKFHHWTLDGATYSQNPLSFTMNSNHTLTPSFVRGNVIDNTLSLLGP
jgi:hypothetical protein